MKSPHARKARLENFSDNSHTLTKHSEKVNMLHGNLSKQGFRQKTNCLTGKATGVGMVGEVSTKFIRSDLPPIFTARTTAVLRFSVVDLIFQHVFK